MDSLTQIAVGIATVEFLAGKKLGNRSFLYGAVLGTFPDLDVWIGYFFDPVTAVALHRGLTHSLLGILIFSPLLALPIWKLEGARLSYKKAVLIVSAAIFTHVAIDLFTSWGVQLFYPHTMRYSFKTIFVIDPLYTIPWIISLIMVFRKSGLQRVLWLRRGFIWSSVYLLWTIGAKFYVLTKFEQALKEQAIEYQSIKVKPTALNSILWQAQVKGIDRYYIGDYSFFDTQSISFNSFENDHKAEASIKNNPAFVSLQQVTEGWYVIQKVGDVYYMNDLRFGVLAEKQERTQFVFSYIFTPKDDHFIIEEAPKTKRDGARLMQQLWKRIKGN